MIKYIIVLILLISGSYSQNDSIKSQNIRYYDLDLELTYNVNAFFSGVLTVKKNGAELFRMDSTYSDYIEHSFADLNGDGSNELVLSLSEGGSPYIFNSLYIFDIKRDVKPLFMVQNGYLDTTVAKSPKISVNARMSPSFMGLWYNWFLEYKKGRLVYWEPDKKTRKSLRPDVEGILENMKEVSKDKNYCDDFIYGTFFENVFICYKLSGEEYKSEDFFNKYYKCPQKISALKGFKEYASNSFNWIKDENNYLYSEF